MYQKLLITSFLILLICGCRENPELPIVKTSLLHPDGNFILSISNQSSEIDPIDIKVEINGETIIHKYFALDDHHNGKVFKIKLPNGKHKIKVSSLKDKAVFSKTIELKKKKWATIDYWNGEQKSQFYYSEGDKAPIYM